MSFIIFNFLVCLDSYIGVGFYQELWWENLYEALKTSSSGFNNPSTNRIKCGLWSTETKTLVSVIDDYWVIEIFF